MKQLSDRMTNRLSDQKLNEWLQLSEVMHLRIAANEIVHLRQYVKELEHELNAWVNMSHE